MLNVVCSKAQSMSKNFAHIVENSRKAPTRPSSVTLVSSRRSESITADHLTDTLTNQTCRFQLQVPDDLCVGVLHVKDFCVSTI